MLLSALAVAFSAGAILGAAGPDDWSWGDSVTTVQADWSWGDSIPANPTDWSWGDSVPANPAGQGTEAGAQA
jgi:hypothetical protein